MEKLHLISGLPRSGSTLLCNILNMNKRFHATPTSPIMDVLSNMRSVFSHNVTFKAQNRLDLLEPMRKGMKGFLDGYFDDHKVVFDKSRGWPNKLPLLDKILEHENTKIIWTYRNPIEVISSIEKRYQETFLLESADESNGVNFSTIDARVDNLIGDGGIVWGPVKLLDSMINRGERDRILFITYHDLTNNTQQVMDAIHDFIGEKKFNYSKNDFKDLKQSTFEFDGFYNYKFMHDIKEGEITYKKHDVILPDYIIESINERFKGLNDFLFSNNS